MGYSRLAQRHSCLAVCTPGLEPLVADELSSLGVRVGQSIPGGVKYEATTRQLYVTNLWLRTATRVLVRVASFDARNFAELERRARETEWSRWLGDGTTATFRVTATKSRLYHTRAITERLENACASSLGRPAAQSPSGDDFHQEFVVRVNHDRVTISVNSSGTSLYKRGWRGPQGKAPLRETLAAALLLSLGWGGSCALTDPMCGSGTIAIEAALIARNLAPGRMRSFGFSQWPTFEPGTWASATGEAEGAARDSVTVPIAASDRDQGAVTATAQNAERAGVAADIQISRCSISDTTAPEGELGGWLVTNPPYGRRASGSEDLRNLYARIGQLAEKNFPSWGVGMLVADPRAAIHCGLDMQQALRTTNGGIDVRFMVTAPKAGTRPAAGSCAPSRAAPGSRR